MFPFPETPGYSIGMNVPMNVPKTKNWGCLSDLFGAPQPDYAGSSSSTPAPTTKTPTIVTVEIVNPAFTAEEQQRRDRHGAAAAAEVPSPLMQGPATTVPIPDGATHYHVSFSPVFPAGGDTKLAGVVPIGIDEPGSGAVSAGGVMVLTPTWARLVVGAVAAAQVKATLMVTYTFDE
jgi:hypothetical protein